MQNRLRFFPDCTARVYASAYCLTNYAVIHLNILKVNVIIVLARRLMKDVLILMIVPFNSILWTTKKVF